MGKKFIPELVLLLSWNLSKTGLVTHIVVLSFKFQTFVFQDDEDEEEEEIDDDEEERLKVEENWIKVDKFIPVCSIICDETSSPHQTFRIYCTTSIPS